MREHNDGIHDDNILHSRFTAYLGAAVRNRKINYLKQNIKLQTLELSYEIQSLQALHIITSSEEDPLTGLPVVEQLENFRLQQSLRQAKERELYILFARALYGRSFAEIALELEMKLKTVTSIYYRLIERLRDELRGDER